MKNWNGGIYIRTIRRTRREAIEAFVKTSMFANETWSDASKYGGHQAVKVTVSEAIK